MIEPGRLSDHFVIAREHPALAGHFPGNPIVPGVVILAKVLQGVTPIAVTGIPQVKFLSPLRPGERCDVSFERAGRRIEFDCRVGDRVVAKGTLQIESGAEASP